MFIHSSQLTAHSLGQRRLKSSIFLKFFLPGHTPFARALPFVSSSPRPKIVTARPANSRGFTLVELMIVVALLAIFASIAVPSFISLIANIRTETTASELHSLLVSARSSAVTQRTQTSLDASTWQIKQGSTVSSTLAIPEKNSLALKCQWPLILLASLHILQKNSNTGIQHGNFS